MSPQSHCPFDRWVLSTHSGDCRLSQNSSQGPMALLGACLQKAWVLQLPVRTRDVPRVTQQVKGKGGRRAGSNPSCDTMDPEEGSPYLPESQRKRNLLRVPHQPGMVERPQGLLPDPMAMLTKAYREWALYTKLAHWGRGWVLLSCSHKTACGGSASCKMRGLEQDTSLSVPPSRMGTGFSAQLPLGVAG